jgi:hypothetical protein
LEKGPNSSSSINELITRFKYLSLEDENSPGSGKLNSESKDLQRSAEEDLESFFTPATSNDLLNASLAQTVVSTYHTAEQYGRKPLGTIWLNPDTPRTSHPYVILPPRKLNYSFSSDDENDEDCECEPAQDQCMSFQIWSDNL